MSIWAQLIPSFSQWYPNLFAAAIQALILLPVVWWRHRVHLRRSHNALLARVEELLGVTVEDSTDTMTTESDVSGV
jgi:hypothetical protein